MGVKKIFQPVYVTGNIEGTSDIKANYGIAATSKAAITKGITASSAAITGTLSAGVLSVTGGTITSSSKITATNLLTASSKATFTLEATASSKLTATALLTASSKATVGLLLTASSKATVNNLLTASSKATVTNLLTCSSAASVAKGLTLSSGLNHSVATQATTGGAAGGVAGYGVTLITRTTGKCYYNLGNPVAGRQVTVVRAAIQGDSTANNAYKVYLLTGVGQFLSTAGVKQAAIMHVTNSYFSAIGTGSTQWVVTNNRSVVFGSTT